MPTTPRSRRLRAVVAVILVASAVHLTRAADAQEDPSVTSTTSATVAPDPTDSTTTTTAPSVAPAPSPEDPAQSEGLEAEPVPVDSGTVPPRQPTPGEFAEVGRLVREELDVATAKAVTVGSSYFAARQRTIDLEARLDLLEARVTELASVDRTSVRRLEAARRHFGIRAANATVRGRIDDFIPNGASTGNPNELAMAHALLGSVLDADRRALQEYLAARAATNADLLVMADQLVDTRLELEEARAKMVEARRANVSAQITLSVLSAGSDIVIHGFVFPVGAPHSFGDSFGAPRMIGTTYAHAHQGTDIFAPMGTPLVACERGIVTKVGTDVLGGNKLWLKGESGTYYYYAHLSAFAGGVTNGQLVDAGTLIGYVGDTGNAKGTSPHLHFEIHPDGGPAANPYPLLKVVDRLNREAGGQ